MSDRQMTVEERLIEWAQNLHEDPWNYWPPATPLSRIREEGAGASQATAEASDGGLSAMLMVDGMADAIDKDRRCAEVREAVCLMPAKLLVVVDVTYRSCASRRDVPRSWKASVEMSGLSESTFARRRREMLSWLAGQLCLTVKRAA